jgi:peptidoglycan/xylan/chitin deacetylase (PgdA/CDA1 family)
MRPALKHLGESLIVVSGAHRLALRRRRGQTLVLAYHNIVPAGAPPVGDASLHLSQTSFAAQLDALVATHDVISLANIDEEPGGVRPRAVITVDDGYRGAVTAGVAELARRGLPATIFVSPGLFGSTTWWDRLAEPAGGAVPPTMRDAALAVHQGRAERVLADAAPGGAPLPAWAEIATEAEVRAAAARPGITLGAHSWSHANLAALGPEDLAAELERPLEWLRGLGARGLPWLAYTYGLTSPAVTRAAEAAGYVGAFLIDGGWIPAGASARGRRFDLPRLNIPSGLSLAGFRLRTAGLLAR